MLYEAEKYSESGKMGCAETSYLPGWDCHGLPIEQKALKAIGVSPSDRYVADGIEKSYSNVAIGCAGDGQDNSGRSDRDAKGGIQIARSDG